MDRERDLPSLSKSRCGVNPYETAYQIAREKLESLDLADVAFNSSAVLSGEEITLSFLGESFQIAERGKKILRLNDKNEPKIAEKIILLHYLITADGTPLSRQEITFQNITGASFYYPTYKARTIDLLLKVFNNDLKRFLAVCLKLGAKVIKEGTASVKTSFLALPNVPVNLIYWCGEKELPPNLQIIYDANITHYLPLEDIVVVTELLTHKIIKPVCRSLPAGEDAGRCSKETPQDSNPALYDYH